VEYGLTFSYGSSIADPTLTTNHAILLRNLTPSTLYHFRVTSTNLYGFSSSSGDHSFSTLASQNPIRLSITSPKDKEAISGADVRVEGTVINTKGSETGVVVDGIIAIVYGNRFITNHVPLAEGENTITATAKDVDGNTETASVNVKAVPKEHYIKITATVESGISPLETLLTLDTSLDVTQATLTYTGPADVEFLSTSANEYHVKITVEGIYSFTARVTDSNGTHYQDTISITVFSKEELDALLKTKWERIRSKLLSGDIEGSLAFFDEFTKQDYRELFNALSSVLAIIAQEMSDIQLIEYTQNTAIYDIRTIRRGIEYSFQLLFTQDINGIWRITSF